MRNSERGASQVPLVLCIVILLGVAGWGWNEHGERESLKSQLATIRSAAKSAESPSIPSDEKIQDLIRKGLKGPAESIRLEDLAKVIGYVDEASEGAVGPSADKARAALDKFLNDLGSGEFVLTFPTEQYVEGGDAGIKITTTEAGVKVNYGGARDLLSKEPTAEAIFDRVIIPALRRMTADIKRFASLADTHKKAAAAAEERHKADLAAKDKDLGEKVGALASVETEKARKESELRQERDDAQAARSAAEEAAAAVKTDLEAQIKALTRELQQSRESVQVLKEKKRILTTDTSPDGTITAVGNGQSTIVLDLGKKDNLIPGTNFEVYGYAKGGREVYKGSVKVVMVGDETSQASILDLTDSLDPLVAGDRIRSLTYDPKHQMRFALAGRFQKMGRSDAAMRLKSLGCAVDDNVGLDTDYLVVGAPETEDQPLEEMEAVKAAKTLGITVITEKELSRFTRY